MLLRASGEAGGENVRLEGSLGDGDGGVEHGRELIRFAEAAGRRTDDLEDSRTALIHVVGPEAFVEAAATVGIFSGLVRVADSIGIPLDEATRLGTDDFRAQLGIDSFGGARNTQLSHAPGAEPAEDR